MLIERADRTIPAPSHDVWRVLADLASWPAWHPGLRDVIAPRVLDIGSTVEWIVEGRRPFRTVIADVDEGRRLIWVGGPPGLKAVHIWSLDAIGGETRLVNIEVISGLLPILRPKRMRQTLATSLRISLRAIDRVATDQHS